jgi:hypothetical protein
MKRKWFHSIHPLEEIIFSLYRIIYYHQSNAISGNEYRKRMPLPPFIKPIEHFFSGFLDLAISNFHAFPDAAKSDSVEIFLKSFQFLHKGRNRETLNLPVITPTKIIVADIDAMRRGLGFDAHH